MTRLRPQQRASRRVLAAAAGVVTSVALLAACTTGGDPDASGTEGTGAPTSPPPGDPVAPPDLETLDEFYAQELSWSECDDYPGLECTTLLVPMDYGDPAGRTLEIAVNRVPSSGEGERIGSLVVNPGGPGGSGLDYAAGPLVVSDFVLERYDLVGFDPRGVGVSSPLRCFDDEQTDAFLAIDQSPDDDAEREAWDAMAADFAAACDEADGELLPFLGTVDVARDLDVLRAALGDDQLHYLGKSYGTFIGALYAEQFPDHVGRMVLDGAVDPSESELEQGLGQSRGFEAALAAFAEDCLEYLEECSFDSVDEGIALVGDILDAADAGELDSGGDREVTQSLATLGIAVTLYDSEFGWPLLRQMLPDAAEGDGEMLLLLSDVYTEREPDGSYASNGNEIIYAVNCMDGSREGMDLAGSDATRDQFEEAGPRFGEYLAYSGLPCFHWPAEPTFVAHEIAAEGAAPIVVVGTTRDPATPYESAVRLAEQLESGVLLTHRGDGHTAYQRGVICIDEAVDAYLLDGTAPEDGTTCR